MLEFLKNGSGIHIKESLKGSFTKYCNGKVTNKCILKGKNSPDPKIRKKATFAANARRWKHKNGGLLFIFLEGGKTLWLKVGNFLNSGYGLALTDTASNFLLVNAKNKKMRSYIDLFEKLKYTDLNNSINYLTQNYIDYKNRLYDKWMLDYMEGGTQDLPSSIVMAHLGNEQFNNAIANERLRINNDISLIKALADIEYNSGILDVIYKGLGIIGKYLANNNTTPT